MPLDEGSHHPEANNAPATSIVTLAILDLWSMNKERVNTRYAWRLGRSLQDRAYSSE